jgi:hypothetical protein
VLSEGGGDGCQQADGSAGKNEATFHGSFSISRNWPHEVVACTTGRAVLEFSIA